MSDIEYRLNNLENAVLSINGSISSFTQTIVLMIKDIEDIKKGCEMNNDILKALTTLKEECIKHKSCSECPLYGLEDKETCYLNVSPNRFDLNLFKEDEE